MTGPAIFSVASDSDLHAALATVVDGQLRAALTRAGQGHRLRVADLPAPVMHLACQALQGDERWVCRILVAKAPTQPWEATATKLIELRNTLGAPLLAFLPPGLRTPAEDSLDIATFTELPLERLGDALVRHLLGTLDADLAKLVNSALDILKTEGVVQNLDQVARFLLSTTGNGGDGRAAGFSVCVFGLVPDLRAFQDDANLRSRLHRNMQAVRELADDRRPLQERIARLKLDSGKFGGRLFGFLRGRYTLPRATWCSAISETPEHHGLTLEHWPFRDGEQEQELRLLMQRLALPRQTKDRVRGTAQMPVLDLDGKKALKLVFQSRPSPAHVKNWKHFRFRILRRGEDGPIVAWESNNYAAPTRGTARRSRDIKVLDLQDLEEDTYYARVDAFADDGSLLNRSLPLDPDDPDGRKENESENFLVVREGAEVEPEKPRAVFVVSFEEAYGDAEAKALADSKKERAKLAPREEVTGSWREPLSASVHGDTHFGLSTPGFSGFTVRVPAALRRAELASLKHPDLLGWYRLDYRDARNLGDVEPTRRDEPPALGGAQFRAFMDAREAVFTAILEQHEERGSDGAERAGIVEVADLLAMEALIVAYGDAYRKLADGTLDACTSRDGDLVGALAQLDVIEVRWRSTHVGTDPGRALVVGPTHPLRLLWHLRHAQVASEVLQSWADGTKSADPNLRSLYEEVLHQVQPQNLPLVLFDHRGRAFAEQELLTPHWSLYLQTEQDSEKVDLAACRDKARSLLGVRRITAGSLVSSTDLAERLIEYIELHPYVEQLRINLFHPGDGQLLADTLRKVEQLRRRIPVDRGPPPELRYAINMFTTPGKVSDSGLAIEDLLDPERQVGEDDEFTLATGDHLHPKLVFSRNHVEEFLRHPEAFHAHVSILLEQFRVEGRLRDLSDLGRSSFVGGLVHEASTLSGRPGEGFAWIRGVRPGGDEQHPVGKAITGLLDLTQRIQSTHASGSAQAETTTPVLALTLTVADQALIRQVHDASNWVLTIDRNLGLDYFDRPSVEDHAGYLLDFTPEYVQQERQRLLLTTRCHEELEEIVGGFLSAALTVPDGGETAVLEGLRSLSGRLALRLLAGSGRHAEVLGLLMARWMLERSDLLKNHILIPVDAHHSWFTRQEDDDASQRRADLLLVGVDPKERVLEVFIVEVKLRRDLQPSDRAGLYAGMAEQAANTKARFRARFDQNYFSRPRADLALRTKELSSLLTFYLGRSRRYGLVEDELAAPLRSFFETLDQGYRLRFRMGGVVFVQSDKGFHVDDIEPDLPVYRFGSDYAQGLLDEAVEKRNESRGGSDDGSQGGDEGGAETTTPPAPSPRDASVRSLQSVLGAKPPADEAGQTLDDPRPEDEDVVVDVDEPSEPPPHAPDEGAEADLPTPAPDVSTAVSDLEPDPGPEPSPGGSRPKPTPMAAPASMPSGIRFSVGTTSREILPRTLHFHPSNTELSHLNIGIVGDMGTGKTQLTKYLVTRLALGANANRGQAPRFLIFDYKKDYSKADFAHAVNAKLVAPEHIPLNILRLPPRADGRPPSRADWVRRGNFLYDTLHKIYGGIGPVQKKRLRKAVVDSFKDAQDEGHEFPLLSEVLERYTDAGKPDSVESILSDLVDLEVFSDDRDDIQDFGEFFQGVVVVKLNELGADQLLKNTVVVFFLNLFYDWMLRIEKRPFVGTDPQLRFIEAMLLIDEADNIMQYDFAVLQQVLQQGREFGVGVLLASQYLSHFFRRSQFDYREPLLTWFVHKVPNIAARDLEGLGLTEVGADLATTVKELRNHEFLCKTLGVSGKFAHGNTFWKFRQDAWAAQNPERMAALQQEAEATGVALGRQLATAMTEVPPDLRVAKEDDDG